MNSCLYTGNVRHQRHRPVAHGFDFPLFLMYLDLDELPTIAEGLLFAHTKPALARFRRIDHLGAPGDSLADSVRDLVEAQGGGRPGPVRLLANPRTLGFSFNPISVFYCFDDAGSEAPTSVVAEVSNTPWNERHCYVLTRSEGGREGGRGLRFRADKTFHVSPFMEMAQRYHFAFGAPGETLALGIRSEDAQEAPLFDVALRMERRAWSAAAWRRVLLRYPAQTHRVLGTIYWHAQRLKRLGVPWVPHPKESTARLEGSH